MVISVTDNTRILGGIIVFIMVLNFLIFFVVHLTGIFIPYSPYSMLVYQAVSISFTIFCNYCYQFYVEVEGPNKLSDFRGVFWNYGTIIPIIIATIYQLVVR